MDAFSVRKGNSKSSNNNDNNRHDDDDDDDSNLVLSLAGAPHWAAPTWASRAAWSGVWAQARFVVRLAGLPSDSAHLRAPPKPPATKFNSAAEAR